MADQATSQVPTLSIQQIMERLGGDQFIQRLWNEIHDVSLATDVTGQKGKVTLTIASFKEKGSDKGDGYVGYETKLMAVPPAPPARRVGLYVSQSGIHLNDPRQVPLPVREVEAGNVETRQVQVGAPAVRSV